MKSLAGACVLIAIASAVAACGGSHRKSGQGETQTAVTPVSARAISSSRLILGRRVRCTATVTTPVEAGQQIGVEFSLHNVSERAVKASIQEGSTQLVLESPDGTSYDTRAALAAEGSLGGPFRSPVTIPRGVTKRLAGPRVSVRWKGPLRIAPGCENKTLPDLRVNVEAAGPPPSEQAAIADVVAATGHILDRCRPQKSGVPVDGRIDPPSGGGPSMDARCSVRLHSEGKFLVAQVLILIPPHMRGVHVQQPYDTLSLDQQPRPYEAIAWQLVVTKDGAATVAGSTRDTTRAANRMAPEWSWSGSEWSRPGSARCGYEGLAGGPTLDLISVCP